MKFPPIKTLTIKKGGKLRSFNLHFTGFMYNTFFRTEIEDQDHRKYLDTYMGPNAIASSMMGVVRNYVYTLACRVSMDLLIPITRMGTISFFHTFTFKGLKKATFAEGFLHTRFFRQIFETGLDMFAFSTFWIMTKYKNKYVDPPPEPTTTAAPPTTPSHHYAPQRPNHYNRISYEYYSRPYVTTERYLPDFDSNQHLDFNPYDNVHDRYDTFYHQYIQPHTSQQEQESAWNGIHTLKEYIVNNQLPRSLSSEPVIQLSKTKAI